MYPITKKYRLTPPALELLHSWSTETTAHFYPSPLTHFISMSFININQQKTKQTQDILQAFLNSTTRKSTLGFYTFVCMKSTMVHKLQGKSKLWIGNAVPSRGKIIILDSFFSYTYIPKTRITRETLNMLNNSERLIFYMPTEIVLSLFMSYWELIFLLKKNFIKLILTNDFMLHDNLI